MAAVHRFMERLCRWMSEFQPSMGLLLGLPLLEAVSLSRRWECAADSWRDGLRDRLFLGADSDHPGGVFAEGPSDLVCMTNEEYEHWFGKEDRG